MTLRAVVFDLGNTLIEQQIDDTTPLDELMLVPLPGAGASLTAVHEQFATGLLSNTRQSTSGHVKKALARLGWEALFDAILTSTDISREKPDREPFYRILRSLGVTPGQAVMVGNDLDADIRGSQTIGMSTIFFSCNPHDWQMLRQVDWQPDHVIESLVDLPPLLRAISTMGE